jgi:hypothetical protein
MAKQEAGSGEWRPNSRATFFNYAQMRVGSNSWQPRNITRNRQSDSLNKSQLTLSCELMKGEILSTKMMMSENQSSRSQVHVTAVLVLKNSCSELSMCRPTMTAKERGDRFSSYTCHVMGEREELDGQWGHIIGLGWDSHFPAAHSCDKTRLIAKHM